MSTIPWINPRVAFRKYPKKVGNRLFTGAYSWIDRIFMQQRGTVMIGAFEDEQAKEVLGIKEEPLYIIPVGKI